MDRVLINVHVHPGSKKKRIEFYNGLIEIWVRSPAEKGKANKELLKTLGALLGISTSKIKIVRGVHSRDKVIEIELSLEEYEKKIAKYRSGSR